LITHGRCSAPAWKVALIAGKPTLTTDPSMKARLEARMVVARTSVGYLG
jgi:hypothetical protein